MVTQENNLSRLNDILFEQLDRLSDTRLTKPEMEKEIERTKGIVGVSNQIISAGNLVLKARMAQDDRMNADLELPKMLEG